MSQAILVVDCGTFATAAAVVVDGQAVPVADPVAGSARWRTLVFVDGERLYAGGAAELRRDQAPDRYSDGLRSALDAGRSVVFGVGRAEPGDVLAGYLSTVRAEAERRCERPVDRLTLTVPPGCRYRDTMLDVAARLGFPDAELVTDAVAAVDGSEFAEGDLVLVCDLGATWTVSLVQVGVRTMGHEVSGERQDVDRLLLAQLGAPDENFVRGLRMRLYEQNLDEVVEPPFRLTRVMLDRCAEPALRWLIASCRAVVARAGVALPEVAGVLLVGGGVLPQTAYWLREGLGRPVLQPSEPEFAVIRGAARWAAGVSARRVRAEPAAWRLEPLTWDVPVTTEGSAARLLRWLVAEGQPYARGAPLAQVRTADDRVFDLTAARAGVLMEHRVTAGTPVRVGDVAALTRASDTTGDGLERRHHMAANGDWILTPDRRLLVECDGDGVRVRTIGEAAVVHELRLPQPGQGNVFFAPSGAMAYVAWDRAGTFNVWDVSAGRLMCTFSESGPPVSVLVNETDWRLLAESGDGMQVGRYRRPVANVWDLGTGARIERLVGDDWRRRRPGYTGRTRGDGFAAETTSPDGRLRASTLQTTASSAAIVVREVRTDREVFRADGVATQVRAAFSADGQHLLANWRQTGTSWADIWQL
ncbi:hypothetical protein [Virgisporangium aurantiacum]|uniref:Molecular chaperone DnaK (HSP70) n=1 Tax=Virgisporangium aurantiacum TaxID=175570 RepID=A0A8J4E802_9ACTN|nr:hypothetical protein [Virgisporangium aurantiacum]GIJ62307.1 hypothetical protein Vau01_098230 [Virgisporangium aurantiacum]